MTLLFKLEATYVPQNQFSVFCDVVLQTLLQNCQLDSLKGRLRQYKKTCGQPNWQLCSCKILYQSLEITCLCYCARPSLTYFWIAFKVRTSTLTSIESTYLKLQYKPLTKFFDRAVCSKIAKIATKIAKIAIWRNWLFFRMNFFKASNSQWKFRIRLRKLRFSSKMQQH